MVRYHRSFISMNKIFRSVNAKNLDDVLYDVSYINHNFNQLKKRIIKIKKKMMEKLILVMMNLKIYKKSLKTFHINYHF